MTIHFWRCKRPQLMSYLFSQFLRKGCATSKLEAKICDLLTKNCEIKCFENGNSKLETIRKVKTKGQFWVTKLVYYFNWKAGFTKMRSILQCQRCTTYFVLFSLKIEFRRKAQILGIQSILVGSSLHKSGALNQPQISVEDPPR